MARPLVPASVGVSSLPYTMPADLRWDMVQEEASQLPILCRTGRTSAGRQNGVNLMDHTAGASGLRVGDRVEVVTRFTGNWVAGFEVATTGAAGCRVRRLS